MFVLKQHAMSGLISTNTLLTYRWAYIYSITILKQSAY